MNLYFEKIRRVIVHQTLCGISNPSYVMYYKTQFKTLILSFSCILINITIYFKKINKNVQMK